ncbi:MAG: sigma-70 family RNA polymerase sigma factor [Defluviitaleaceae bacterium]|nr:sigma-70 family RNA polymerase sigma factor [Defluviitaleaceae bacterium]
MVLLFNTVLRLLCLLSYITNSNSFPKPLTSAEEREVLQRFASGDTEARNTLIERNLRLVAHIVKKYSNHIKDAEDLISVGTIGLIKAISTYNIGKGTKLATYAARCIDNAIQPQRLYWDKSRQTRPLWVQNSRLLNGFRGHWL